MKIIINNIEFPYNIGCRLLKLRDGDKVFKGLEDIWEDIVPMTFKEIATDIRNTEQRRVAMACLGLERLVSEVKPKLINTQTLSKQTTWVNENGELVEKKFNDTYELYEVSGDVWSKGAEDTWRKPAPVHYVKCKDTSTDREYLIWINAEDVFRTNDKRQEGRWYSSGENYGNQINAIQAIAWTIQTDVPKDMIEKIVRQGDCILIKKRKGTHSSTTRHLTEEEYKTLLELES